MSLMVPLRVRVFIAGGLLLLPHLLGQQASKPTSQAERTNSAGGLANGVYHNSSFGFSYKVLFGWVERTAEMREDDSGKSPDPSQAQVLLAVFERPPEAISDTVNSAVVIAAESVKSYPGLKAAVDYFAPLEEITKAKGFKVVNEPYEFSLGAKKIAREDFSKPLGNLTMQQASLVMVQKGYVISFTFIGGSADEVEGLITGLNFPSSQPSSVSSSGHLRK